MSDNNIKDEQNQDNDNSEYSIDIPKFDDLYTSNFDMNFQVNSYDMDLSTDYNDLFSIKPISIEELETNNTDGGATVDYSSYTNPYGDTNQNIDKTKEDQNIEKYKYTDNIEEHQYIDTEKEYQDYDSELYYHGDNDIDDKPVISNKNMIKTMIAIMIVIAFTTIRILMNHSHIEEDSDIVNMLDIESNEVVTLDDIDYFETFYVDYRTEPLEEKIDEYNIIRIGEDIYELPFVFSELKDRHDITVEMDEIETEKLNVGLDNGDSIIVRITISEYFSEYILELSNTTNNRIYDMEELTIDTVATALHFNFQYNMCYNDIEIYAGIRIGSNVDEIIAAFGEPDNRSDASIDYYIEGVYYYFDLKDDRVTHIYVSLNR